MNKLDTALITDALKKVGFSLTKSVKEANVVLINTCLVRKHAEQGVLSHLGHLKYIKCPEPFDVNVHGRLKEGSVVSDNAIC